MRRRSSFLYAVVPAAAVAFAMACNSLEAAPISPCADDEPGAQLECVCQQNPHDARCMEGGAPEADGSIDANASDAADAADVTLASDAMDASSSDAADAADDAADAAD